MIDTISNTITFSSIWQYVGPLLGVGFGYLISDKVWNKQKQWEMKRDQIYEALRAVAELDYCLIALHAFKQHERLRMLETAHEKFAQVIFLTDVVVGTEVGDALNDFGNEIRLISVKIIDGNEDYFDEPEKLKRLQMKIAIKSAARKELNIRNTDCAAF
ncbi:MAG: hypothetical protein WCA21_11335 [Terracidiphilus sp.]